MTNELHGKKCTSNVQHGCNFCVFCKQLSLDENKKKVLMNGYGNVSFWEGLFKFFNIPKTFFKNSI